MKRPPSKPSTQGKNSHNQERFSLSEVSTGSQAVPPSPREPGTPPLPSRPPGSSFGSRIRRNRWCCFAIISIIIIITIIIIVLVGPYLLPP